MTARDVFIALNFVGILCSIASLTLFIIGLAQLIAGQEDQAKLLGAVAWLVVAFAILFLLIARIFA